VRWDFGYCGHYWPVVPAPDDRWWWLWRNWWNEDWQGKPKYSEETCPSATLSTTNPTWLYVTRIHVTNSSPSLYHLPKYLFFYLGGLRSLAWSHSELIRNYESYRQSVGILRRRSAERHPCIEWDSKPRPNVWVAKDVSCLRPRAPWSKTKHF
jgi:hypothetical protein